MPLGPAVGAPTDGTVNITKPIIAPMNDLIGKLVIMIRSFGARVNWRVNQRRNGPACSFHCKYAHSLLNREQPGYRTFDAAFAIGCELIQGRHSRLPKL